MPSNPEGAAMILSNFKLYYEEILPKKIKLKAERKAPADKAK